MEILAIGAIICLSFMILVAKILENEVNKQKDIIQEQADEIEYLNFIIELKRNGKVASCQSWIVERFLNETKDSIHPDEYVTYSKNSKTVRLLTNYN